MLVIAFGAFGTATDFTEAQLEEGHDTATQTENEANAAYSKFAGIAGFVEFRLQLRLTQALNHLLRSQLFERIQALPMRVLNDQRIGDSLYRVHVRHARADQRLLPDHHVARTGDHHRLRNPAW